MKVVVEMGNVDYYENRAVESILQAHESPTDAVNQLRQAVGLLLLALSKREQASRDTPAGV